MNSLTLPLTNMQTELLKLYGTNLSDAEMHELRGLLSKFYAEKAIRRADEVWEERGLTDADMENWLNKKF